MLKFYCAFCDEEATSVKQQIEMGTDGISDMLNWERDYEYDGNQYIKSCRTIYTCDEHLKKVKMYE